jgi:hypothetical protein
MSKRTLFLIFALFITTIVLLAIAVYQPQTPKTTTQITPTPREAIEQTVLSIGNPSIAAPTASSSPLLRSSGLSYSIPIRISTGKNKVTAVQLELQYDPLILVNVELSPGPFFASPTALLNLIDNKTGRISYALGIATSGASGNGIVANLNFSVKNKNPQDTAIIFLPKTLVVAEGRSESVLKEAKLGKFTVGISNSTSSAAPIQ